VREAAKIAGLASAAAIAYGVALDQVTARLSLEYFSVAHPSPVGTTSPSWLGAAWGVVATWWVGVVFGLALAGVARAGARPPRSATSLVRPIVRLLLATAACAFALGALGWLGASRGALELRDPWASEIAPARHARFFAAWGATGASYVAGLLGAILLCAGVWRSRGIAQDAIERDARA